MVAAALGRDSRPSVYFEAGFGTHFRHYYWVLCRDMLLIMLIAAAASSCLRTYLLNRSEQ